MGRFKTIGWLLLCFLPMLARADYQACLTALEVSSASEDNTWINSVLGEMPPLEGITKPKADALLTEWSRKARTYLLSLKGTNRLRGTIYTRLLDEISTRSEQLLPVRHSTFGYTRYFLTNGAEFFVGEFGHFTEIHPDGRIFFGQVPVITDGEGPDVFEPGWVPPFDIKGEPNMDQILRRYLADPNFQPQK